MATCVFSCLVITLIVSVGGFRTTGTNQNLKNDSFVIPSKKGQSQSALYANNITCTVMLSDSGAKESYDDILIRTKNIVFIDFLIDGQAVLDNNDTSEIFEPLNWIRVRGRKGEGLLWLRDEFEVLSLSTLQFGVDRLKVNLKDSPRGCFLAMSIHDVTVMLRNAVLNDLQFNTTIASNEHLESPERLCNKRIRTKTNSYAEFFYECCNSQEDGIVHCSEMKRGTFIYILFTCILVLKFCAIMFAPLLVPRRLYRAKYGTIQYEHKLKSKLHIKFRTAANTKNIQLGKDKIVQCSTLRNMPYFKNILDTLQNDTSYEVVVDKIHFKVKVDKLITKEEVPVGIAKNLFNNFVMCNIRHNRSVKGCCKSSIFGTCISYTYPWFKVLSVVMTILFVIFLAIPWIVRLCVYFYFEDENRDVLRLAADKRGLIYSFSLSLTLLLTPLSTVFIACYSIILVYSVCFVFIWTKISDEFKFTLKQSFRHMCEKSGARQYGWCLAVLLKPFEKCGCFGCILAPFYWLLSLPFLICVLLFYSLPTMNILLRLITLLLFSNKCFKNFALKIRKTKLGQVLETDTWLKSESRNRPLFRNFGRSIVHRVIIFMSIVFMMTLLILLWECLTFFVEIFVYTSIGIILNADSLMKFVSLGVMLFMYAADCFGSVTDKYIVFNKTIVSAVKDKVKDELMKVAWQHEDVQKNTAFQVESEIPPIDNSNHETNEESVQLVVRDGILKWNVGRLLVFLNNEDIPLIPEKFFFKSSYMSCSGSPGPLFFNLLKATKNFLVIIVFLLFVALVVAAFGDFYNVSSTNQTLATLAGGFLPFMFRKFLFKSPLDLSIDTSNLHFQACFNNIIHSFQQSWPVQDIILCEKSVSVDVQSGDESTNERMRDNVSTTEHASDTFELGSIPLIPKSLQNLDFRKVEKTDTCDFIIDMTAFKLPV